ncbi:MAG: tyrosine--tRNA ligase [Gemmatimonadetes bacterium]|nr:tyrosine--tRNA ligase [Gemmatimonadota bacterium]MDA1103540.1 tyrosine--tRNA ligase [Gemmatimonadota bacterium]
MSTLLDEYRARDLLHDATEGVADHLGGAPRTVYIGFDPTAESLHLGNLVPIMGLVHAQRAGHTPIALVGGGTGLIGDPSGKTAERQLLTKDVAAANAELIRAQLEHFLDFGVKSNAARMRNNHDWLGGLALVDFLRDMGKHFSVNQLLAKESVKRRLQNEETGISYTEFSYALLQSYDFLELYRQEGCTVQMGGSDQWGNITAGIDLVRRVEGGRAFGVVFPLITKAAGTKFGKSEGGSIWLDPEMTSPFRFYQYWINVEDADAVRYLKLFTLLPPPDIAELAAAVENEPQRRAAQRALADDVTSRLHGETGLAAAQRATRALFSGEIEGLTADEIADVFADVPSSEIRADDLSGEGTSLVDLLVSTALATSKGDARRVIEGGGVYLNNVRADDPGASVRPEQAIEGRYILLRKGKKSYHMVAVVR